MFKYLVKIFKHNNKLFRQGIADIEPNFTDFVVFTSKENDVI